MKFGKRLLSVAALAAVVWLPLAARGKQQAAPAASQSQEQAVSRVTLTGTVRTADGTVIPGASVTIVNTQTSQKWLTWSDENGKYSLYSIPVGSYHLDATELGLENAAQNFELTAGKTNDVVVTMHVATLSSLAAANNSATGTANNPAQQNRSRRLRPNPPRQARQAQRRRMLPRTRRETKVEEASSREGTRWARLSTIECFGRGRRIHDGRR